jgi:UTP--glucose-1-phosphate uridylyltransferase
MWELDFMVNRPRKAVIPAAGLGKRFYPLTRAQPKEMLPIVDKPLIHYIIEEAVKSGLDEILIIVGSGKDAIVNYFDSSILDKDLAISSKLDLPDVFFVRQKEILGLGDSIRYSKKFVGQDPFVILLGDTIYTSETSKTVTTQIIDKYVQIGQPVIAVEKVLKEKISDYGIIGGSSVDDTTWKVNSLVEKPAPKDAPSNLGITGTYILDSRIFKFLETISPGKNGEYQLTDALSLYVKKFPLYATLFSGKRYDVGTKELWIRTFLEFVRADERFSHIMNDAEIRSARKGI